MAVTSAMESIFIIILSFIADAIFYYYLSKRTKSKKRKQISIFTSLFIDFVIYIWLGKLVVNKGKRMSK
ncbi:hypothetical protein SAMN05421676_10786 [Salinibacillus kushneri]|uniref:Uncharacterized protein n=1 Tax=Salinibacillus kushneri TaxID=237682 RepID=A0A1I0GML7_9BACI|nr:hypothetical protein [Salinibacillus kushneri]SET72520.1 hypothetical protein SAMN05421676_10786 [Salinibacillus kushneri]